MKAIYNLILSKIFVAFPDATDARSIAEKEAAFYRMQIEVLLRILETKGVQRILATPDEIHQLISFGKNLDHDIKERIMIVRPETYTNWLRRNKRSDEIKRPGRKRSIAQPVISMVIRLVKENPGWGWLRAERRLRIVGELKKLGITIAVSTLSRICKDNNLPMPPRKNSKSLPLSTWSNFIKCNMDNIVSTDFFSKTIYTLRGKVEAYSLAFVHYGSRRVFVSPPTFSPDAEWVQQQARNAAMWMEDEGIKLRYLIHDSDTKFPKKFVKFFERIIESNDIPGRSEGKVIKTAVRCPPQNGYVETWIGHFKAECLNAFVCFSLRQFGRVISSYQAYYNNFRPHQSLDNKVIDAEFSYPEEFDPDKVKCCKKLGGLLKHYYIDDEQAA